MSAHSLGRVRSALAARRRRRRRTRARGLPVRRQRQRSAGARRAAGAPTTPSLDARDAARGRRAAQALAARRPPTAPARARARRRAADGPGAWPPHATSCGAAATRSRSRHHAAGRARQVREPQRAAGRAPDPAATTGCSCVDDDVDLPRGFLDRFLHVRRARPACALAQPAHRATRTPPGRSRDGGRGRRARDDVRRDRAGDRFHRDTFATLLPFPDLRMGWGLDAHWAAVARGARLADRRRRRHAGRAHASAGRRRLRARGASPRRAPSWPTARTSAARRSARWRNIDEGRATASVDAGPLTWARHR